VTHYYVYYRVDAARAGALRAQVDALLRAIESGCGVRGRWMRRRDDPSTFMEVYEGVRDEAAFEALLARESAPLGLDRHTERFRDA